MTITRRILIASALFMSALGPLAAAELPTRKAGLWEVKITVGPTIPQRTMQQCVDAATDKLLNATSGGSADEAEGPATICRIDR